jgi:ubiquitin-like 1-activating enzyme E1 B
LNDLVENILRTQLKYGQEFSINTEQGTIYDPDLEDNLPKKLSDLGITTSTFLTVIDEDEQPRVNLQLIVVAPGSPPSEEQPIVLNRRPEIPQKPQAPAPSDAEANGTSSLGKRKRDAHETELNGDPPTKRVANVSISDGADKAHPIDLSEAEGGAILIDDD